MAETVENGGNNSMQHIRPSADPSESFWYVAHTCANREKRVGEQLLSRSVEHFLPLYASIRRWKDRKVELQLPLFPGYVFVKLALRDQLHVLQIPGVARLVSFGATPAALPADEIETLRRSLEAGPHATPHPMMDVGRDVRVKSGPMAGLRGILKRRASRTRLVVSVQLIQRAIALEIDEADIELIG